ncbi:hypothetical protein ACQR16_12050 [Bradyrhizobium oligotrophicum]|uniref:hypothetical protein n=1 Tax=Bradyrhizobium oligotrophicum TaxID=44255 RepID=UPI003EC0333D
MRGSSASWGPFLFGWTGRPSARTPPASSRRTPGPIPRDRCKRHAESPEQGNRALWLWIPDRRASRLSGTTAEAGAAPLAPRGSLKAYDLILST